MKATKYKSITHGLKDIYHTLIEPVERYYDFHRYHMLPITDSQMDAKPMILLIGQYSTGKTSFIRKILGEEYPECHIGPEPTTDCFTAVMHGTDRRIVPGCMATKLLDKPFHGLDKFGTSFLDRFRISQCPNQRLENITIVDTPGILSGEKQSLGRDYSFQGVAEWFGEKADIILLIFDALKLDISDEFKSVIHSLRSHWPKIRILLNKVDTVGTTELLRIYGALLWVLGKILDSPEVPRIYVGSYGAELSLNSPCYGVMESDERLLVDALNDLPTSAFARKINDLIKRCKTLNAHMHVVEGIRVEEGTWFNKTGKRQDVLRRLEVIIDTVARKTGIPRGDFPSADELRTKIQGMPNKHFPRFKQRLADSLERAIRVEIPQLIADFPLKKQVERVRSANPFSINPVPDSRMIREEMELPKVPEDDKIWTISGEDRGRYEKLYYSLVQDENVLKGERLRNFTRDVVEIGVSELEEIWNLVDPEGFGFLAFPTFCAFMKIMEIRLSNISIPKSLPSQLRVDIGTQASKGIVNKR